MIADLSMQRVKALPAANAAALTDVVDLGSPNPIGKSQVPMKVRLTVPALPSLADTKYATFELYDCDTEGGSYAVVQTVGNMTRLGAGGAGAAAKTWEFYLPPSIRQFIKVRCAVDASGGNNTGVSYTVDFLT